MGSEKTFLIIRDGDPIEMAITVKAATPHIAFNDFMASENGVKRIDPHEPYLYPGEGEFLVIEMSGLRFKAKRPDTLKVRGAGKGFF